MSVATKERKNQLLTAGLIFYKILNGRREYLIMMENNRFHDWAMPKGRIQYGESELEAAKREAIEEAGLYPNDYDIFPSELDFKFQFEYRSNRKYKHVTGFGARVIDPNVTIVKSSEHIQFEWAEYRNLKGMLYQRVYNAYNELEQQLKQLEGS